MTETRSVGQEIVNSEVQEIPSVMMKRNKGNDNLQRGLSHYYEPQNRREPFLPLVFPEHQELSSASFTDHSSASKPKLKLRGVMSGMQGYYASIQNSDGKRYIVAPGSVIPSEGLKVKKISEKGLEFEYLDERKRSNNLGRLPRFILSF